MNLKEVVKGIFQVTVLQQAEQMRCHFWEGAVINWHNTNESFSREEYIRANCEYPGKWEGTVQRIEELGELLILVGAVKATDLSIASHVVSFYRFEEGKVIQLDEYWGEDGEAPKWRLDMHIGRPIKNS